MKMSRRRICCRLWAATLAASIRNPAIILRGDGKLTCESAKVSELLDARHHSIFG